MDRRKGGWEERWIGGKVERREAGSRLVKK